MTVSAPPQPGQTQPQQNPLLAVLKKCVDLNGADIHLKVGLPPKVLVDGKIIVVPGYEEMVFTPRSLPQMLFALLQPHELDMFKKDKDLDTAFEVPGMARFRANVFMNIGAVSAVLRIIQNDIRDFYELGLPPVLRKLAMEKQGLILVTGPTGSGKTTSLAAVINFVNETIAGHLVSIEDPIEIVHPHKRCVISQREVGRDCHNFGRALKSSLRQAPNVILIGELRDRETIELALKGAETGHLVFSTLHTGDAVQTIQRILNVFAPHEQESIRLSLANTLKACIAQRLLPRLDGKGRVPILDIMVNTLAVRDAIMKNNFEMIYELIKKGSFDGMQSQNQALVALFKNGIIDFATAMGISENKTDLSLSLRGEMRNIREEAMDALRRVQEEARLKEAEERRLASGQPEGGGEEHGEGGEAPAEAPGEGGLRRPGTGPLRPGASPEGAARPGTDGLRRPGSGPLPPSEAPPRRPPGATGPIQPGGRPASGPLKR